MQKIKTQALFGVHRQGDSQKTGKPYNFIEISDGFSPALFSTDLDTSMTAGFEKGDNVECEIAVNPFNSKDSKIISIVKL